MPDINPNDKTQPLADYSYTSSTTKFMDNIVIEPIEGLPSVVLTADTPPWRVELNIIDARVQIVFDFNDSIYLGRPNPKQNEFDGIDFSPFDGHQSGISRRHAQLSLENNQVMIRDLGSTNGTVLNGASLQPKRNYVVNSGDIIHLGKLKIRIRFLYNPFSA